MTLFWSWTEIPRDEYWNAAHNRYQPKPTGLRLGGNWRKKLAESENDRKPDQVSDRARSRRPGAPALEE